MHVTLRAWWRALRGNGAEPIAPRLLEFRNAVVEATRGPLDRRVLDDLSARPSRLGFAAEDVELEMEMLDGAREQLVLESRVQAAGLPVIRNQHKVIRDERCHFAASVSLVSAGGDQPGRLFMTERRLVFMAAPLVAMNWSAIARVGAEGRDLVVLAPARSGGLRFRCNSIADARCGRWLSERLRNGSNP